MGFYKPGANHPTDPSVARLHNVIWTLIFGGLLTLVLGIFVGKTDDAIGWIMVVAGAVMAAVGCVLIYVRSRIKT
jgi:formate hydrogenlyase subunit 3/multisubunit Na+/H+ antiporter MnhD subunit